MLNRNERHQKIFSEISFDNLNLNRTPTKTLPKQFEKLKNIEQNLQHEQELNSTLKGHLEKLTKRDDEKQYWIQLCEVRQNEIKNMKHTYESEIYSLHQRIQELEEDLLRIETKKSQSQKFKHQQNEAEEIIKAQQNQKDKQRELKLNKIMEQLNTQIQELQDFMQFDPRLFQQRKTQDDQYDQLEEEYEKIELENQILKEKNQTLNQTNEKIRLANKTLENGIKSLTSLLMMNQMKKLQDSSTQTQEFKLYQ